MTSRHRLFVLTDIDNEPDDAESFVRLLLYTNEIDLEGVVAVTSTWLRNEVHPETLHSILDGYEEAYRNLVRHDPLYPTADTLRSLIKSGYPAYGNDGVGVGRDSEGSDNLIAAIDREDEGGRPLHVALWGGANCLAQALWKVLSTRSSAEAAAFAKKVRVYGISDQDNTGPWIRRNFPAIPYVVSLHGNNSYSLATWHGISGETITGQKTGPVETIQKEWLAKHIQIGPLGQRYPTPQFIMEGDTPSYLSLIPNGLNNPERPDWGGWGGRYDLLNDPEANLYLDSVDTVLSPITGEYVTSPQASIWRWREHFQQDFRARMRRTLSHDKSQLDPPRVVLNGDTTLKPLHFKVNKGSVIDLDASASTGENLSFNWYHYKEVSTDFALSASLVLSSSTRTRLTSTQPGFPTGDILIEPSASSSKVQITLPSQITVKVAQAMLFTEKRDFHVILEVTSGGEIPITRYRRIIVTVFA